MINITINSSQVQTLLQRALRTAKNPESILRAAGTTLLSITRGTFTAHGAHLRPQPWPPKKDGSPSTLRKSGTLWRSFQLQVSPREATISTPVPYAAIHQFGGQTPARTILPRRRRALAFKTADSGKVIVRRVQHPGSKIPARPFFPITPEGQLTSAAAQLISGAIQREFERQIRIP